MNTAAQDPSASSLPPLSRTIDDWRAVLEAQGERGYRATQVFRWLQQRGVFDPTRMTDLGRGLRESLKACGITEPGRVLHAHCSQDGTKKLLVEFDESTRVECVLIPMTKAVQQDADAASVDEEDPTPEEPVQRQRVTLCLSTQFGCAMGCVFCASGRAGLTRGLSASEIVAQVLLSRRYLEPNQELRNLVFMGMGEPLHHYDETARAIRLLTDPDGQNLSPRRITVSTVGLVPKIQRLGEDFEGKVGLAVSLHAPTDALRDRLLPVNRRYPLADLMQALRRYPLPRRRRITIEYTLIAAQNDQERHANQLARLLRGLPVKVNLIPMNPVSGSEFCAPSAERVSRFRELLAKQGYSCFVRTRRGDDVAAACGQLAMGDGLLRLRKEGSRSGELL